MKKALFVSVLSVLLFSSCDNLLLIEASQLHKVTFESNGGSALERKTTQPFPAGLNLQIFPGKRFHSHTKFRKIRFSTQNGFSVMQFILFLMAAGKSPVTKVM